MKRFGIAACLLAGLAVGCGSSNTASGGSFSNNPAPLPVQGRTLTINQPALDQLVRNGDRPDTLDVEGFDASGQRVFGPVRVPLKASMQITQVPESVVNLQLDYLRNGGFMLFRADAGVDSKSAAIVPLTRLVAANDTTFRVQSGADGFVLTRELTGDLPSAPAVSSRGVEQLRIKGMCYSPAPINFSNKQAPAVGDLFWDSFLAGSNNIYGWAALFLNFEDPNIGKSRADIERIRNLGANTIRLYSCISYQLGTDGGFPDQSTAHRFSHKAFLDACYNHQEKPLNVLVDIPMPDVCFRYRLKEALDIADPAQRARVKAERAVQIAWWEANLRATVEDLSQHPAVLGFNIMNEQDGAEWSHPNVGQGPDNEDTQFFYAQSIKYAGIVKAIDNTKLCGWAFHDSPDLVIFGSQFPTSGRKYLEQLSDFDYWGINTYQTKNFDAVLGPGFRGSYSDLPASMKKPVLLTELGWPATGHNQSNQLIDNSETQHATAVVVKDMYQKAFANPLIMGACYFEFSDEWWKQPGGSDSAWDPGNPNSDFPNRFGDEEGFGLFAVRRQGGRANNDRNYITFGPDPDAQFGDKGPQNPYDALIPRQEILDELKAAFQNAP